MSFDLQAGLRQALAGPSGDRVMAHDGIWRDRAWLVSTIAAFDAILADAGSVGLVARNRPLHVAACVANLAARRATAMITAGGGVALLADTIRSLRLPAIIADRADWSEQALDAAEQTGTAAIAVDDGSGITLMSPGKAAPRTSADFALELLSSGTTGVPKRIGLPWRTVAGAVADAVSAYAGSAAASPQIMVHPLGNISGLAYAVPPLIHGRPLVLLDRFDALDWARAVRIYRPKRGAVPPPGLAMLLEADVPATWLQSLDLVAVGGGRLDPALHDAFEQRYGIPVLTAYGATEFGGVIANWTLPEYRARGATKRGSAGRASHGARLRIVASEGRECAVDETGLLEAQVQRIGPEWIRTTDLARIDVDGFLFVEGRADAAINRGGFTILPENIAEALRAHPDVRDAAVIGMPDPRLGEVPVAVVETVSGRPVGRRELDAWLRDRLLPWQVPRRIMMAELPRTTTMKVSIPDVRALIERMTQHSPPAAMSR